ncbi:substrate-binding domain-containing protein [Ammonicoccus fulvus]|uniref:Phosphate-binding protein n=1 Tax=Ammonicoccus fulvus TaxID=3138240 RepID=A0ABZ3FMR9_9ACTN
MTSALAKAVAVALTGLVLAGCGTANPTPTAELTPLGPATCPTGEVVGAGSPVVHNALDELGQAYRERCAESSSAFYRPIGVEAALTSFAAAETDWTSSDVPIEGAAAATAAARCVRGELWNIPLLGHRVVISFNLPGVDELTLSADVLARILDGRISQWNDPAIAAVNPGRTLPDLPIKVLGRADSDGTTRTLSTFLAANSDWPADKVGAEWTGTGEKLDRTADLLTGIRSTPGAITYADASVLSANALPSAAIDAGAGPVEPTTESASAALQRAELTGEKGDIRLTPTYTDNPAGAYPVVGVDYQIVCTQGAYTTQNRRKAAILKDFLGFAASDPQQKSIGDLGYVPLPDEARSRVRQAIATLVVVP